MKTRAAIFLSLNAVRVLSLIGLLLVFSSSIVVLVNDIHAINASLHSTTTLNGTDTTSTLMVDCDYLEGSTVPNQPAGAFWAIVNRFLIIFETIILILSEFEWPKVFFTTFFPVLGPDFGLGALGIFECLIGASVLSHHIDTFPLASAFFLFSIGVLNIFVGLIFRDTGKQRRSLTEWRDRVPELPTIGNPRPNISAPSVASSVFTAEKPASIQDNNSFKAGYGFGRQGEKAAGLKGFLISKPLETLPRYAPKPTSARSRPDSQSFHSSAHAI